MLKCLFSNIFLLIPLFEIYFCKAKDWIENDMSSKNTLVWPKYKDFGQISAVGVDTEGNIYVFHRGNRRWDYYTFENNDFVDKNKGPILNETVVVINSTDGSLLTKAGADLFYLPHGLTIDKEHNIWLTDVAMHQVFRFPPLNLAKDNVEMWKPTLTLGVLFEHGSDDQHFCKPTSVAVDDITKDFYVSDGYCNGRIIKYDQFGKKILQWGIMINGFPKELTGYMLSVPHSLALAQDSSNLFVADREHFRVTSYDSKSGKFQQSFAENFRSRIFSVALHDKFLFALTNNDSSSKSILVFDFQSKKFLYSISSETLFTNPHDLTISPDGKFCYVVELNPNKIWKIKLDLKKTFPVKESEKGEELNGKMEELNSSESKIEKSINLEVSSSFLAVGLVVSIVVITFLFFMFHYYKRKTGFRRYETKRLILDEDESGIQLT